MALTAKVQTSAQAACRLQVQTEGGRHVTGSDCRELSNRAEAPDVATSAFPDEHSQLVRAVADLGDLLARG